MPRRAVEARWWPGLVAFVPIRTRAELAGNPPAPTARLLQHHQHRAAGALLLYELRLPRTDSLFGDGCAPSSLEAAQAGAHARGTPHAQERCLPLADGPPALA